MKRQATGPNRIAQEMKHLVPGRIYTLKAITADYQDVIHGRKVEGSEVLPDGCYSGKQVRYGSHGELLFPNGGPWLYHHRVMFRATAPTATLTIFGWAPTGRS